MDVNNKHLRKLLDRTDNAFKALLLDPNSRELNDQYDQAKQALDEYIRSARHRIDPES